MIRSSSSGRFNLILGVNLTCDVSSSEGPVGRVVTDGVVDGQGADAALRVLGCQVAEVLVDRNPVLEPGHLGCGGSGNFGLQDALLALFENRILVL